MWEVMVHQARYDEALGRRRVSRTKNTRRRQSASTVDGIRKQRKRKERRNIPIDDWRRDQEDRHMEQPITRESSRREDVPDPQDGPGNHRPDQGGGQRERGRRKSEMRQVDP